MNEDKEKDWDVGLLCEFPGCTKSFNISYNHRQTCLEHAKTPWWKDDEPPTFEDL